MILRVPYFYREFQCLADKCKDSCCIGWEIDIDPDTYAYYSRIEGEFGAKLKENIRGGKEPSIRLDHGRCPFLDERNLCEICTKLGEESLCEICTEYPRFTLEFGEVEEKCFGLSCEEAGRLTFQSSRPITFEETMIPASYTEEYENEELIKRLQMARDHAILLVQERDIPIERRIAMLMMFASEVQRALEEDRLLKIGEIIGRYSGAGLFCRANALKHMQPGDGACRMFERRMDLFSKLETLEEAWRGTPKRLRARFSTEDGEAYRMAVREFMEWYRDREYEYEHLMVYFIFRYGMKAAFDGNFLDKMQFAAASFLVIRDMDVERFLENGRRFTKEDRIDIARIYSKEVEHSEDNLEQLSLEFASNALFEVYEICIQILV